MRRTLLVCVALLSSCRADDDDEDLASLIAAAGGVATPLAVKRFDFEPGQAQWYNAYRAQCQTFEPWREELAAYSALHARALAVLRRGNATEIAAHKPRITLSVYRIPKRRTIIGLGCLLPGVANVFLSALRRQRVFLLDWPASEDVFEPPLGLPDIRAPWKPLARALGAHRREAHYKGFAEGYNTPAQISGVRAPDLWGDVPATDPVDVETHWIFNRGTYTHLGAKTNEEHAWLINLLPRDVTGSTLWGCVYAAVVPLSASLLKRSEAIVSLPAPPLPPALPQPPARTPPPLICLHVRTWALEPVPVDAPPAESKYVRAAFSCLDRVLRKTRGGGGGVNDTVVFIASDDVEVRSLARARFERDGVTIAHSHVEPAQIAFINKDQDDAAAADVINTSWSEWARLSRCPVLIASAYSGYARSAAAAGWGSTLYYYDEAELGPDTGSGGETCFKRESGAARELTKGFGAGW